MKNIKVIPLPEKIKKIDFCAGEHFLYSSAVYEKMSNNFDLQKIRSKFYSGEDDFTTFLQEKINFRKQPGPFACSQLKLAYFDGSRSSLSLWRHFSDMNIKFIPCTN